MTVTYDATHRASTQVSPMTRLICHLCRELTHLRARFLPVETLLPPQSTRPKSDTFLSLSVCTFPTSELFQHIPHIRPAAAGPPPGERTGGPIN